MCDNDIISGYLDVKISSKSRRGLTPWKAWQKQWCEIKKLDCIDNGVELKLKSSHDGSTLNVVKVPRSAKICRTESRTKQYAFGVFTIGRIQKPLLYLAGNSEHDSQAWMSSIRKMLSIALYLPVGESNFHVSLVDNKHSRAAGIMGLFGVLGTNQQEIIISDPCTGEPKLSWKWYHFHQFHLQASTVPSDEHQICVLHTSGDFIGGPGQLYLYCKQAPQLLNHLISRGKRPKLTAGFRNTRRLSRSEGDLREAYNLSSPESPLFGFRSNSGSEDSGVRVSMTSDDFNLKTNIAASLVSIGMAMLSKTPGGSETGDSLLDLSAVEPVQETNTNMRRESGISIASGIYEEILDNPNEFKPPTNHIYEDPFFVSMKLQNIIPPPPLPPRVLADSKSHYKSMNNSTYKQRCNTLPAKDLQRMSQIFVGNDSEYMVMSPSKVVNNEEEYTPMFPNKSVQNTENLYVAMNGKR